MPKKKKPKEDHFLQVQFNLTVCEGILRFVQSYSRISRKLLFAGANDDFIFFFAGENCGVDTVGEVNYVESFNFYIDCK